MRASLVVLALAMAVGASPASADPITISVFDGSGVITDLEVQGRLISFDLSGLSGPIFLQVDGLRARRDYQVAVNLVGSTNTAGVSTEILNALSDHGNERDPDLQPGYIPAGFSTSTDYDGFSFAQGSRMERGFLAAGVSAFGVVADELTDMRDMLTFSGVASGPANLMFGLRDWDGGRSFLLRIDGLGPLSTPEPGSMLLVGGGLLAIARLAKRRRARR
jgi:hypothetical protein